MYFTLIFIHCQVFSDSTGSIHRFHKNFHNVCGTEENVVFCQYPGKAENTAGNNWRCRGLKPLLGAHCGKCVLGKIASSFGDAGIAIKTFVQKPSTKATGRYVPLVYILGDTTRERLNEALEEISTFTFVKEIKSVICVADLDN